MLYWYWWWFNDDDDDNDNDDDINDDDDDPEDGMMIKWYWWGSYNVATLLVKLWVGIFYCGVGGVLTHSMHLRLSHVHLI